MRKKRTFKNWDIMLYTKLKKVYWLPRFNGNGYSFRFEEGHYYCFSVCWLWFGIAVTIKSNKVMKAVDKYMIETYGQSEYKWVDPDIVKE